MRPVLAQYRVRPPCTVVITRWSPQLLDSDNAETAAKRVRDGVADALGIDDGDTRVVWVVAQHRAKQRGVLIEIYAPGSSADALLSRGEHWIRSNAHALDVLLPLLRK